MIELENVMKQYDKTTVIRATNLTIAAPGLTCLTGVSGSGKTTLLNLISLIETPTQGRILFEGEAITTAKQVRALRRQFGYVFQNYGLVEEESVADNLALATRFSPLKKQGRLLAYREAIEQVGLRGDFLLKKVHTLSGGEQQRVALARLLLTKPRIVFADEPTGNLDNANRDLVFKLLKRIAQQGTPVIYVSHDPVLIADAQEVIQLPL